MATKKGTEAKTTDGTSSLDQAKAKMNEFRQRTAGSGSVWGHPGVGIGPDPPSEPQGAGLGAGPAMPPPWAFPPPPPFGWGAPQGPPGMAGPPFPGGPSMAPRPGMPAGSLAEGLGTMIRLGLEALNSGLQALVGQAGAFPPPDAGCGCHESAPHGGMPGGHPHGCSCCLYSQRGCCCNPGVSNCG
jgi:hypothetical protein